MSLRSFARLLIFLGPLLAAACTTPTLETPKPSTEEVEAEARQQRIAYARTVLEEQDRLARISYKLSVPMAPLCGNQIRYATGAFFFDWDQTRRTWVDAANEAVGINLHTPGIEVLIVVPDSPAREAGFQVGDRVVRFEDWRVPTRRGAFAEFRKRLDARLAAGGQEIEFRILRGAEFQTIKLTPIRACDYPVVVEDSDRINAYTDGRKVVVYRGMLRLLRDDDDLASIVAHELSHIALKHVDAQIQNTLAGAFVGLAFDILIAATTDIYTSIGTNIGATIGALAYSQEFEAEADYMSAYILARAGYDFTKLPDFYRYLSILDPESIDYGLTHPSFPERVTSLQRVVREIDAKIEQGLPLVPEQKARAP